ncbi:hypothetical protein BDY21DRAFT_280205 [Lineolata rhizophorae]|uniref:Uncharacterized protein n=1 Tax=Lineolata rhizophorae TaxID=578093 RepID=A0A6A6P9T3_9PEZI|nr:hypothetical protein BDY21DRAFT_280205 [Lineolata rhizophorae]
MSASDHSNATAQSSTYQDSEPESDPPGPWSPPAWRRHGTGWFRASTATSPGQYDSAQEGDITLVPANVPLPASPLKGTPRSSPEPNTEGQENVREGSVQRADVEGEEEDALDRERSVSVPVQDGANSCKYIRFAVRAEVQHRSEPFEAALLYFKEKLEAMTHSRISTFLSVFAAVFSIAIFRLLFQPPSAGLVPDLVKVAGMARSFEPLIHFSENGFMQIADLQETGVAVWDLGESVRTTNMTSAPIITNELDELSDALKTLSRELTKFFTNVNGDVDAILIVMDWAKRELASISSMPSSSFNSVFDNIHTAFCRVGLLEYGGVQTALGKFVSDLFGQTAPQRTKSTLQRTFNEFLDVLEEAINNELTYSTTLFALFDVIEKHFSNLQRTVARETDQQEREEDEMLSSLWTRVIGGNKNRLRKYEKNKQLLRNMREKTIQNKSILVSHNHRLDLLKESLENLRKRLVSPLVRSNESASLSIDEQIRGLDAAHEHLRSIREIQKARVFEKLFSNGNRRLTGSPLEIDPS